MLMNLLFFVLCVSPTFTLRVKTTADTSKSTAETRLYLMRALLSSSLNRSASEREEFLNSVNNTLRTLSFPGMPDIPTFPGMKQHEAKGQGTQQGVLSAGAWTNAIQSCKTFPRAGIDPRDPVSLADTTSVALAKLIRETPPLRNLIPAVLNDVCNVCNSAQSIASVNGKLDFGTAAKNFINLVPLAVQEVHYLALQVAEMKKPSCKKAFEDVLLSDSKNFCECLEKQIIDKECGQFSDITVNKCWMEQVTTHTGITQHELDYLKAHMENIYSAFACENQDAHKLLNSFETKVLDVPVRFNVGLPPLYKFCTHEIGLLQITLGEK